MSVEAYKAELEFLREELAQKEKDVAKAAEIGKFLLESNQDLEEQLEKQQKDNQLKIDDINQECYSLKKKLESKNFMEQNYLDDIEKMKTELKKHRSNQETAAELELQVKLAKLKKQNGFLQQEFEKTQLSDKQSLEKIDHLSEEVESLRSQLSLRESRFNETCSEEMAKLLSEVACLQKEKCDVTNDLKDSQDKLEQYDMQVRHLQTRLESSREEIEEKECQICSFQNSIEKFKVEILDMQAQLDAARSENVDLNKKGNSLFAEVDDRRCGAERELKSLRSRYETEHKNNEVLKQRLHRLKMQIPSLLEANVGRGDSAYMESLEKRISHVKAENEMLRAKSGRLELDLEKVESKVREELTKFNSDKNNREYSEFMQGLLAVKSEEITQLKESLQKKELQLLLEVDSKAMAEKKVYQVKTQLDQAVIDTTKLKLKIEELKLKYEPDSVKVGKKMERRHYEKIPMPDESAVTFTEERRPVKGLVDKQQIKKQQKDAVDEKENKPKLKSTVRKTVSISDDVEVKEMSFNEASMSEQKVQGEEKEGATGAAPKTKVKGKVHHNVKYVSSDINEKDQCKQQ